MERMNLELEMLKQNEIDKQPEHEQKILELELEAKRKMAQTEKEIEFERTTVDIELKMRSEMEKKRLESEKQFGVPITRPTTTIKLPKLELQKFDGDILKWQEFWDSFEASIHRNPSLQPVDKSSYLRAELEGVASTVISGLELTNSNYEVAVSLLQERLGRDELMIDSHYSALMDLHVSLNHTANLRATYDMIEKHLRSLKALGENVDQPHFVFLIESKLPKMVISRMEEYKDMEEKWTVESILKALKRYICTQEVGERQTQVIQSPEGQNTAVKPQNRIRSFQNGLVLQLLVPYFLEMKNLLMIDRSRGCFYCQRKDHWRTSVKLIQLLRQERQKSKKTALFV